MVIIDKPGQTCNRFWSYLDIIGYSIKRKTKVYILFWDSSLKYYNNLLNGEYTSFPLYSKLLINLFGEKRYLKIINKIFNNRIVSFIYKTLNVNIIIAWNNRASYKYYPSEMNKIKDIFRPNQNICDDVEGILQEYKNKNYFIIGVHIRRGDYKYWEHGKYYFELKDYASHMIKVSELYNDKKLVFFISTNEPYLGDVFKGINTFKIPNATVAHDLYALSLCDRILGPLSTFSRWASFYGHVPLCFIEKDKYITSDSEFSVIHSFYLFENGIEIPNLTDKKE